MPKPKPHSNPNPHPHTAPNPNSNPNPLQLYEAGVRVSHVAHLLSMTMKRHLMSVTFDRNVLTASETGNGIVVVRKRPTSPEPRYPDVDPTEKASRRASKTP